MTTPIESIQGYITVSNRKPEDKGGFHEPRESEIQPILTSGNYPVIEWLGVLVAATIEFHDAATVDASAFLNELSALTSELNQGDFKVSGRVEYEIEGSAGEIRFGQA